MLAQSPGLPQSREHFPGTLLALLSAQFHRDTQLWGAVSFLQATRKAAHQNGSGLVYGDIHCPGPACPASGPARSLVTGPSHSQKLSKISYMVTHQPRHQNSWVLVSPGHFETWDLALSPQSSFAPCKAKGTKDLKQRSRVTLAETGPVGSAIPSISPGHPRPTHALHVTRTAVTPGTWQP